LFPMCCRSAACGTTSQMMQSATRNSTAAHIMSWFAFATQPEGKDVLAEAFTASSPDTKVVSLLDDITVRGAEIRARLRELLHRHKYPVNTKNFVLARSWILRWNITKPLGFLPSLN